MNKDNILKEILSVANKYNLHIFSIVISDEGNLGVIDTIGNHQIFENMFMQLYNELKVTTFSMNSNESSENNVKNIPIGFLMGCMKATMKHLSNLQSNSEMDKYNQFSKGIIDGLSDEEINKFIDTKLNENIIPIEYFNFNKLEECKGKGNVHIVCSYLSTLCNLCEYLQLNDFRIISMPNGNKDLTVPHDVSFNKVKEFLQSDIRYNAFKLEEMDIELMRKICKDHPYPEEYER